MMSLNKVGNFDVFTVCTIVPTLRLIGFFQFPAMALIISTTTLATKMAYLLCTYHMCIYSCILHYSNKYLQSIP